AGAGGSGRAGGAGAAGGGRTPPPSRGGRGGPTPPFFFPRPPYSSASQWAGPLSERLPAVVSESARIVSESDKRNPLELSLPLVDERVYGDTRIAIHPAS